MVQLRAPAEKLSLAVRKNLRDAWESKKPEYEDAMKEVLGVPWTIEFNPNLIYQYADDDRKPRLGDVITWYMDAFISNLRRFQSSFGSDGVQELNFTCAKHKLIFAPQENTTFSYGGLLVEDGTLKLVFAEDALAVNVDDVSDDFATPLKEAAAKTQPSSPFNIVARNAVRKDYDPEIEDVRTSIAKLVNMPNLALNGNFEKNAAELSKADSQVEDFDKRIGFITLNYFQSLKEILNRENFADDDMQQEAFQEAVEMAQVCVRVLPKWSDGISRYNEVKIEEGVLYIQTTPENWGVNVDDACLKLVSIL